MVRNYLSAINKDAWKLTWSRFAESWQGWFIVGLSFLIGVSIHTAYKDWSVAFDDAVVSAMTGLGGTAGVMVLYYAWKLFSAPYRIWLRDKQREVERIARQDYSKIAKELEAHIRKGQMMMGGFAALAGKPDVQGWRAQAERIVAKCGEEELAMFKTLYPPQAEFDDDGVMSLVGSGTSERDILKGSIAKMRKIMNRQLALAKEKPEQD